MVVVNGATKQLRHFFETVESAFGEGCVFVKAAGMELIAGGMGGYGSQTGQGKKNDSVAVHIERDGRLGK